ncbi:MAG TPA: acyl-CoA dehydrogenase, partial [Erythrobacter sp.]|nr:acyl-CoA dehydrogenase [Erythrobacter sp.]
MNQWIELAQASLGAARDYANTVRNSVARQVAPGGVADAALIEQAQHQVHGYAWIAATVAALEATLDWAVRAEVAGAYGEAEALTLRIGFGEYLAQIAAGLPMSASVIVRPSAFGTAAAAQAFAAHPATATLLAEGNTPETRAALAALLADGVRPDEGLGDET